MNPRADVYVATHIEMPGENAGINFSAKAQARMLCAHIDTLALHHDTCDLAKWPLNTCLQGYIAPARARLPARPVMQGACLAGKTGFAPPAPPLTRTSSLTRVHAFQTSATDLQSQTLRCINIDSRRFSL